MKSRLLATSIFAAATALTSVLAAEQAEKDPIDKQVDELSEKDPSTAGQVEAMSKGVELWDAELNRVYKKLLDSLPTKEAGALKESQRQWIAYRDADRRAIEAIFSRAQGTMYRPVAVSAEMETIKARVLQLRVYLDAAESAE